MKNFKISALLLSTLATSSAFAGLTSYSQNFEAMNMNDGGVLGADGWLVYGNVFNSSGGYLYGYGSFPAPNGTGAFSSVGTGEGGAEQGRQYINIFSDYNNGDHANGHRIEANVFHEQTISAADLGTTHRFTFDYKAAFAGGPGGATTTFAFLKVLNPAAGYATVANPTFETTSASNTNWVLGQTMDITIDASWTNHILQFGFVSNATQYQPSGVYYDNISFAVVPEPGTIASLLVGGLFLAARARRKK